MVPEATHKARLLKGAMTAKKALRVRDPELLDGCNLGEHYQQSSTNEESLIGPPGKSMIFFSKIVQAER